MFGLISKLLVLSTLFVGVTSRERPLAHNGMASESSRCSLHKFSEDISALTPELNEVYASGVEAWLSTTPDYISEDKIYSQVLFRDLLRSPTLFLHRTQYIRDGNSSRRNRFSGLSPPIALS